jgi:hypothetical protein
MTNHPPDPHNERLLYLVACLIDRSRTGMENGLVLNSAALAKELQCNMTERQWRERMTSCPKP